MAEKFNKPERFTKAWYRYVWDYYKVHIGVTVAVILLAVITVYELANTVKSDLNIHFVTSAIYPYESVEQLAVSSEPYILDQNGDGKAKVSLNQLSFTTDAMLDANQIMALESKLQSLFAADDEMLFIFDAFMLRDVLDMSATEGIFIPVSDWCTTEISEELYYDYRGNCYAVSLKDSKILKELNISGENLYVAVRENYTPENEMLERIEQNCVSLANELVKK